MYMGIDLGTSGVKTILTDEGGEVIASHTEHLSVQRPHPLWSEQDAESWWTATDNAVSQLARKHSLKEVQAIGLAGQMHGATLLDAKQRVLRPAILWNDGRSGQECLDLEAAQPDSRRITGNLMMPGFTAPKLMWLARHEPEIFKQTDKVLLPKDYLRFKMTGLFASDMSDASGTMWLDVAQRDWSDSLLENCGLTRHHMPSLYEGSQITGHLQDTLASKWGMKRNVPVIAGGGDNAAGAIGAGIVEPGMAMLSLGTSGVYFAVSEGFRSNPENAIHSFCHALPDRWHLMSVMLSAASCLDWATRLTGLASVSDLLQAAQQAKSDLGSLVFLPYLSGERTPHNNPYAKGVFFGLTHHHGQAEIAQSVLEGVGFALNEGMKLVNAASIEPQTISLIGGGARSAYWRQILADISGKILDYRTGGDVGPALGAAKLAQMALSGDKPARQYLTQLPLVQRHVPDWAAHEKYAEKQALFSKIYANLSSLMV